MKMIKFLLILFLVLIIPLIACSALGTQKLQVDSNIEALNLVNTIEGNVFQVEIIKNYELPVSSNLLLLKTNMINKEITIAPVLNLTKFKLIKVYANQSEPVKISYYLLC